MTTTTADAGRQHEPVGIVEIAERLGVQRETVDQWRARELMPKPDWIVGGRPAWEWSTVERWAISSRRLAAPPCSRCGSPLNNSSQGWRTGMHATCWAAEHPRMCRRCGESISGSTTHADYHDACLRAEHAEQNPPRSWRYHIHGEDWAGADGTVVARSREDAERKVLAQYDAPTGVGEVHIGGSDDLGYYVRVWEDVDHPELHADDAVDTCRSPVDTHRRGV